MDSSLISSNRTKPEPQTGHLVIGCLIYPRMDQIDFTGPFEVLSRIPKLNHPYHRENKIPAIFKG